ncbi:MAG: hypothetical protein H3Z50_03420 [archaeon]|nr:hypothetical protein [archaeon]MCP8306617.1 hypothetical protein [archaeon]
MSKKKPAKKGRGRKKKISKERLSKIMKRAGKLRKKGMSPRQAMKEAWEKVRA